MEPAVFAAMMMGAIPALILLFYMLRPFEVLMEYRPVMFSFVIGMVLGVVVGVLHVFVDSFALRHPITAIAIFVLGFAVFDQFMRVVIFNSPKFTKKMDTVFYSTAFGLGYGAMLSALWFYRTFANEAVTIDAYVIVGYVMASFSFAVVHGTTGMLVGFGASEGIVWRFGFLAVGIEAVLNLLWYPALFWSIYVATPIMEVGTFLMVIAAVYGILLLRWTLKRIVPDLLPREAMRGRRRMVRKRKR